MKKLEIKVNGKVYPIKFGYGATRWIGECWGVPGALNVFQKALNILGFNEKTENKAGTDELDGQRIAESMLKFENMDRIADIVIGGIFSATKEEPDFDRDDLIEELMGDIAYTSEIFTAFILTMPRPKAPTPEPVKKTGKRRPQKR